MIEMTTNKRMIIYRSTNHTGIRAVWDWCLKKNDYVQRHQGYRYIATVEKNGKTTSKSFCSVDDARRWREKTKYDLARLPNVQLKTFKELLDLFFEDKEQSLQITTMISYQAQARHFESLFDLFVEDINSQTIDRWIQSLKTSEHRLKYGIKDIRLSFQHEVSLLRCVFSFYREYYNESFENPVRKRHDQNSIINQKKIDEIENAKKLRYISPEEIENFISVFREQASKKPVKKMYFLMALIQLRTGLRIGEVAALSWQDIDWQSGIVRVDKTVQWLRKKGMGARLSSRTKTGDIRDVIFISSILDELKKLQKEQGRIAGLIFSVDGFEFLAYRQIQHHYDHAFKEANVDFRSTHILRHTFATHFLEMTSDNNALQKIMGHRDYKMTERYAKITERSVLNGMKNFENRLPAPQT